MNYLIWCLGLLIGNILLHQLAYLPNSWLLALELISAVVLIICANYVKKKVLLFALSGLLFGFAWTGLWAQHYLNRQLPTELIKQNVTVIGKISSIPQPQAHHVAFNFRVEEAYFENKHYSALKNIRLSWYADHYAKTPQGIPELKVGQTWRFVVRLKPPHGFASPGASDFSQHLFSQHIDAGGYVYTKFAPVKISDDIHWKDSINSWREILYQKINASVGDHEQHGIIAALALGERTEITNAEWDILQATGTSHLVAISGLHVGLVAGIVFTVTGFLWRQIPSLANYLPAQIVASTLGLATAFVYSALAGFAVPTQRALIMLLMVMYGVLQRRASVRIYTFATAVAMVLLYDPLATLSVSFWLSYVAVAAIFYTMSGREISTLQTHSRWREWSRLQWGISCLLIPVTLWFFQQTPLVSPLANAVAIPWVSFIVVPLTLLGTIFITIFPIIGELLLHAATYAMQGIWILLTWMSSWPYATWQYALINPWIFLSISIATLILFLPKGFPGRAYGIIGLFPLWLCATPNPAKGEVWIDVLDVGQGLATVIRTATHTLVYDTGDQFSERLNAAEAVILPFLRGVRVSAVDTLIISHDNRDHSGGADTLLRQLPVKTIYAGDEWQTPLQKVMPCLRGTHWDWDGVDFEFIHPNRENWQGNNASCVLKISSGVNSLLLTGDIESKAEQYLAKQYPEDLASTILVAPHHGSRSSSSVKFLQQVKPQYVLFPAGYLNRFNFPNPKIVARYQEFGVQMLSTSTHGTIHQRFNPISVSQPEGYRQHYRRYWHPSYGE